MAKLRTRKVVFAFDERSYESLDKLVEQGRADPGPYVEVEVTNPETGEVRVLVIPKFGGPRRANDMSDLDQDAISKALGSTMRPVRGGFGGFGAMAVAATVVGATQEPRIPRTGGDLFCWAQGTTAPEPGVIGHLVIWSREGGRKKAFASRWADWTEDQVVEAYREGVRWLGEEPRR